MKQIAKDEKKSPNKRENKKIFVKIILLGDKIVTPVK